MAVLFLLTLVAAIGSIVVRPFVPISVRPVLTLVTILAAGAMAYLVMGAHVL